MGYLKIPSEPKNIKEFIISVRRGLKGSDDIDYDSSAVWYLNKLPKYLWNEWKDELIHRGYSWQRFLRIMRFHTNDLILWALEDKLNWEELVKKVINTLKRYEKHLAGIHGDMR